MNIGLLMGQTNQFQGVSPQGFGLTGNGGPGNGQTANFEGILALLAMRLASGGSGVSPEIGQLGMDTAAIKQQLQELLTGGNQQLQQLLTTDQQQFLRMLTAKTEVPSELSKKGVDGEMLAAVLVLINLAATQVGEIKQRDVKPEINNAGYPRGFTEQQYLRLTSELDGNEAKFQGLFSNTKSNGKQEQLMAKVNQAFDTLGFTTQEINEFLISLQQSKAGSQAKHQGLQVLIDKVQQRLEETNVVPKQVNEFSAVAEHANETGANSQQTSMARHNEEAATQARDVTTPRDWLGQRDIQLDARGRQGESTNHNDEGKGGNFSDRAATAQINSRVDVNAAAGLSTGASLEVAGSKNGADVIQQLVQKLKADGTAGKSEVKVQLKPELLGKVSLKVELTNNGISAKIMVENQAVKHIIQQNLPQLKDAMQQQGIKVDQAEVYLGGSGQGAQFQFNGGRQQFRYAGQSSYPDASYLKDETEGQETLASNLVTSRVDYLA
ncbi:flagellar hook-length control protein FliK [Metallumcola ferriviriculae]|uniref:Flagellar hook-length control protein FliK n=1 Tax=Metallumcola ferriviriculae TaxID=3039180 RepID=A0AAU0USK5_9FIRM|nr:flagellar hook-length control protein FliK [Desulfitibacteraceae bacterium MK1]